MVDESFKGRRVAPAARMSELHSNAGAEYATSSSRELLETLPPRGQTSEDAYHDCT